MIRAVEKLYVTNRDDWRAWLKKNYNTKKDIWLIYYKKHTGKPRLPYDDAVEEAICFGWIDSSVKRLDDERYAQKFTPRNTKSRWSELNVKRARKMIEEGKMTKAGLAKYKMGIKNSTGGTKEKPLKKKLVISSDLKRELSANKKVWENFSNLAPSYKRLYIGWIASAKKEETRKRRLAETIKLLRQNKKLGMR